MKPIAKWVLGIIVLGWICLAVYFLIIKPDNLGKGQDWKPDAIYKLPLKPGAYVFWKEGEVRPIHVHVGSTGNLRQRISGHEKKKEMTSFDWYQTKTPDEARQLENKLKEELGYKGE